MSINKPATITTNTHIVVSPSYLNDGSGDPDWDATDAAYEAARNKFFADKKETNAKILEVAKKEIFEVEKPQGLQMMGINPLARSVMFALGKARAPDAEFVEMAVRVRDLLKGDPNFLHVKRGRGIAGLHFLPHYTSDADKVRLAAIKASAEKQTKSSDDDETVDVDAG